MKRWLAAFAAPLLSSCVDTASYYGEEFALYYKNPAEETSSERVDSREIVTWKADPRRKKRIGYLYKVDTQVAGSRSTRESYTIYNDTGMKAVGFITAEGVFYRFDALGRLGDRVGGYPILPTGLKVFFGIPMEDNVDLDEIDPYRSAGPSSEAAPKPPAEGEAPKPPAPKKE